MSATELRAATVDLLLETWAEVFEVQAVRSGDGFLEMGGDSLLAAQLLARIEAAFGVELTIDDLFTAGTAGAIAALVDDRRARPGATAGADLVPVPRDQALPLSFAQRRLWFLPPPQPHNPPHTLPPP